jgi:hypothetical protein
MQRRTKCLRNERFYSNPERRKRKDVKCDREKEEEERKQWTYMVKVRMKKAITPISA